MRNLAGLVAAAVMLACTAAAAQPSAATTTKTAATGPATTRNAEAQGEENSSPMTLPAGGEKKDLLNTANENRPNPLWAMFASMLVILLIGGLALVVIKKVLPRLGLAPATAKGSLAARSGRLKVLESVRLGPQRQVHLLEVDGRRYLVGNTQNNITLLAEMPPDNPPKKEES